MRCPARLYTWWQQKTSGIGPKNDDLCPCCSRSFITDIMRYHWYRLTNQK